MRVDVIRPRLPQRGRTAVDLAAPFLRLALPVSRNFAAQAWRSDEGSADGGPVDLWPVNGVLPPGLALVAGAISCECVRLAGR